MRTAFCLSLMMVVLAFAASISQARNWRQYFFFEQDRPTATDIGFAMTKLSALEVVDDVIGEWRQRNSSRVEVIGHADLSEAGDHIDLSLRRAMVIKELLIQHGLTQTTIVVIARGSSQLLVPTNGTKPEPQNRRVEILF